MITLMYSNYRPDSAHVRRLEALAGAGRVAVAADEASAVAHAPATSIVLGHRWLRQILPHAPDLRWVQTTAAGYDQLPLADLARRGIVLTRNTLNAAAIAHHAVALAWALLRRLPQACEAQRQSRSAAPFDMLPLPRAALIIGLGAIGMQTAALLRGLGLHVRGAARSGSAAQRAVCDEFLPGAGWRDALARSDIVVLALPLDASTRGCFGRAEIDALPPHAIVINVARAGLLDVAALAAALRAGRLGGAGLDVLDPIPAADDPLWTTPNLLITPKVAAHHPQMQAQFEAFAEAQVRRYLSGLPLEHCVELPAGGSP